MIHTLLPFRIKECFLYPFILLFFYSFQISFSVKAGEKKEEEPKNGLTLEVLRANHGLLSDINRRIEIFTNKKGFKDVKIGPVNLGSYEDAVRVLQGNYIMVTTKQNKNWISSFLERYKGDKKFIDAAFDALNPKKSEEYKLDEENKKSLEKAILTIWAASFRYDNLNTLKKQEDERNSEEKGVLRSLYDDCVSVLKSTFLDIPISIFSYICRILTCAGVAMGFSILFKIPFFQSFIRRSGEFLAQNTVAVIGDTAPVAGTFIETGVGLGVRLIGVAFPAGAFACLFFKEEIKKSSSLGSFFSAVFCGSAGCFISQCLPVAKRVELDHLLLDNVFVGSIGANLIKPFGGITPVFAIAGYFGGVPAWNSFRALATRENYDHYYGKLKSSFEKLSDFVMNDTEKSEGSGRFFKITRNKSVLAVLFAALGVSAALGIYFFQAAGESAPDDLELSEEEIDQ